MSPRPALPLEVHKLKSTESEAEPSPEIQPSRPKFPRGLRGESKKIFKKLASVLERRRALTEGEEELLRLYANLHVRHAKAQAKLEEEGEVCTYYRLNNRGESVPTEKPNLWLAIAQGAEKNMVSILDRLGLTPLNRSKVKQTSKPKETKGYDPMEELLSKPANASESDEVNFDEIDEDSVVM